MATRVALEIGKEAWGDLLRRLGPGVVEASDGGRHLPDDGAHHGLADSATQGARRRRSALRC
jgi:hypothetical protein